MSKLTLVLPLFLSLLLPPACEAAAFKVVGGGEDFVAFVDSESVVTSGSIMTYNLLYVTSPPRLIDSLPMHYMIEHEKLDCRLQTIQLLGISAYGIDDKIIGEIEKPEAEEVVFPDSLSDSQYNLLCRSAKVAKNVSEYKTLLSAVKAGDEYIKEHISIISPRK
jgi:hypothetical protein